MKLNSSFPIPSFLTTKAQNGAKEMTKYDRKVYRKTKFSTIQVGVFQLVTLELHSQLVSRKRGCKGGF